ncbi:MAG: DUF4038 domain-containing protein, partial [Draconibacterium sp.]|nr:DUF4038 domain-containing protein [Draconibacterium sp.]
MKKLYLTIFLISCLFLTSFAQNLRVHESKRYLETTDGKPFLWIGDTAWELFHRLNREEAVEYLKNRKAKGINVIQAVVLAERDGLIIPNPYGVVPFNDLDPTQPNEAYFEHVDFIVNEAEKQGLYIGMLPTWGDKVFSNHPGAGPIVFNKENAGIYGEFLGNRYKDKPIVWILGGDRNIANDEVLEIWRAMASGITNGDNGKNLITYHPRGWSSSSKTLHNEEWLDFNMYQSGHSKKFTEVYQFAESDRNLKPTKPTIEGEPAYEDIAVKFWEHMDFSQPEKDRVPTGVLNEEGLIQDKSNFKDGFFDDYDVRVHAYWNFLAGACGYTYGNNAIWQMFKKGEGSAIPCLYDWRESMDRPGAFDLQHIRTLLKGKFHKIIPDQS